MMNFLLSNGLRVILAPSATDVVYAGIAVAAGTRHELDGESGMAHLVEHMTFKGTRHLTSTQILNRMERVGGDLNAYTGKEETIYYATFMRQHLHRAVTLLMDIVWNSTYPQMELEKEVEVVIDEIESYNDSPAELIYDDFEALLFPQQPLGRKILGEAEQLRHYSSDDLVCFVRRCYHPARAVLFVKGNVSVKELCRILGANEVEKHSLPEIADAHKLSLESVLPSCPLGGSVRRVSKPVHQAHVMLGNRAYPATDERHLGLVLLNNLLGGPAMSSRLSLALRERTGLVYTVESSLMPYTDTGVWAVYFGCDAGDVPRCLRLVHHELRRLMDTPLAARTLAAAKQQLKGQLGIGYDNFESVALSMAKRYLHDGCVRTPEDIFKDIDQYTPDTLQAIAAEIFDPAHLVTLIYQPEQGTI